MDPARLVRPYRVTSGRKFRLEDFNPADTGSPGEELQSRSRKLLDDMQERMAELQRKLYAQDRWSLLLIFQAMDAAGKDSAIKHVMSGVDPQGCQVHAFKTPSAEELDHDYLWRASRALPERGRIGIFNRSYYEEVLVVRVHPEVFATQKLPGRLVGPHVWRDRLADIRQFESYLGRNGYVIRKFFLNVSKDEQLERFLERLDVPEKNWKFGLGDVEERRHWDAYMRAYEDAIASTATSDAPWFVVPADHKWFTRLVVAAAVVEALESLDLRYPAVDAARERQLAKARKVLLGERRKSGK